MAIDITLYSARKGSNPGGRAHVFIPPRSSFDVYMKYCWGSRLKAASAFKSNHQPFYEGITFYLARKLGLRTSDFYILPNLVPGAIKFSQIDEAKKDHFNPLAPYYFVSILEQVPLPTESKEKENAMRKDKLYRDILMISDVSNKAQNFRYDKESNSIWYLDLGCSFLNATNGFLSISAFKLPPKHAKDQLKRAEKIKNKTYLEVANGFGITTLETLLDLGSIRLPTLYPRGTIAISDVLSQEEIDEITYMLTLNLLNVVHDHKDDPRIVF